MVRQNLRQHFARWKRAQPNLAHQPREVPFHLLFDSRQALTLAGVRGEQWPAHLRRRHRPWPRMTGHDRRQPDHRN